VTRWALAAWLAVSACATGSGLTDKGVERAALGVTREAGAPRRFALLVGVDAFDDPRFGRLRFAGADARDFGAALTGYQSVRVLSSREETSKASVLEALEAIRREATNPNDTVVVYVSSHGTLGRRPGTPLERFIVASDTRLDLLADTGLAVERVRALLEAMPARRKALILALCHSGKGKSALDDALAAQLAATKGPSTAFYDVSEGLMVLTACAFGETARESEALGHDIYTHGLLEGLKHGDRDGDGAITALEAHDYARDATFALTGGEQRPTAEIELVGRDPVVLAGAVVRPSGPVVYTYAPSAEGLRLRVDGQVKGSLPGGVGLEPGQRHVSLEDARSGRVLYETSVQLSPGDRVDLSRLLPPAPGWVAGGALMGAVALSPAVASVAVPPSFGPRLTLERSDGAFAVRGLVGYLTGAGTLAGLGEGVPFRSHVIEPGVGATWLLSPLLGLALGADVSLWIVIRDAATTEFRSVQVASGPSASARLGWEGRIGRTLALGAWARGGVLAVPLESRLVPTALVGLELSAGVVVP
jgi:uncharacterized caspase-like protein